MSNVNEVWSTVCWMIKAGSPMADIVDLIDVCRPINDMLEYNAQLIRGNSVAARTYPKTPISKRR